MVERFDRCGRESDEFGVKCNKRAGHVREGGDRSTLHVYMSLGLRTPGAPAGSGVVLKWRDWDELDPEEGLPLHVKMGLTKDNQGPVTPENAMYHHDGCWCGDPTCPGPPDPD